MGFGTVRKLNFWVYLLGLVKVIRPTQWLNNIVIYTALVFDGKLLRLDLLLGTTLIIVSFCLATSSVSVLNRLTGFKTDLQPLQKRLQFLPSGERESYATLVTAVILAIISLSLSTWLDVRVGALTTLYLLLQVSYNFYLKHTILVNVVVVSLGLLVRVGVGAVFIDIEQFSPWFSVCVTLLALFLGFGRCRYELTLLDKQLVSHELHLKQAAVYLLDQILLIITTSMLIIYTLYTFGATTALVNDGRLLLTVPFVFYFIIRYFYLVHVKQMGGAPGELLWKDRPLLVNSLLWVMAVVGLLYVG